MATTFRTWRCCRGGQLIEDHGFEVASSTGFIIDFVQNDDLDPDDTGEDFEDVTIAPGFIELQTNGLLGFHFTHFNDAESYAKKIDEVARYLPSTGVTGFYITIPTVHQDEFKQVGISLISFQFVIISMQGAPS